MHMNSPRIATAAALMLVIAGAGCDRKISDRERAALIDSVRQAVLDSIIIAQNPPEAAQPATDSAATAARVEGGARVAPPPPPAPPTREDSAMMMMMRRALANVATAQEAHFADRITYTTDLSQFGMPPTDPITVRIVHADERGWFAEATARGARFRCSSGVGPSLPPGMHPAVPRCDQMF
jgi:hypothetical protein